MVNEILLEMKKLPFANENAKRSLILFCVRLEYFLRIYFIKLGLALVALNGMRNV